MDLKKKSYNYLIMQLYPLINIIVARKLKLNFNLELFLETLQTSNKCHSKFLW